MPTSGDLPETSVEAGEVGPEEKGIEWVSHPARARPLAATLTTVFLLLFVTAIQLSFTDWFMTALSAAILAVSLSPFYLPTRYTITEDGLTVKTPFGRKTNRLDRVRRWQADRHGILLSPFDHPSRLDRFHGLNLRFDPGDRERVVGYVRNRFAVDERES